MTSFSHFPKLRVPAPLDPEFQPPALFHRDYVANAKKSAGAIPFVIGLEREGGLISRYETVVDPRAAETLRYVERIVKFLLWARGGWKIPFRRPERHRRTNSPRLFLNRRARI